jgi:hypothetical protein
MSKPGKPQAPRKNHHVDRLRPAALARYRAAMSAIVLCCFSKLSLAATASL